MTELDEDKERTALALQREIHEKRAQVVADIDALRDSVRIRLSLRHMLQTHPKVMRGLTIALGIAGIGTLALLWRATHRRNQLS